MTELEKKFDINKEYERLEPLLKDIPRKDLEAFLGRVRKAYRLSHIPDNPKERMTEQEGRYAYRYLLESLEEDPPTPREILSIVAQVYDLEESWVEDVLNTRVFHNKNIVRTFDKHPIQKEMTEDGTMDRSSLMKANTPNQQLRTLRKQKTVHNRLKRMELDIQKGNATALLSAEGVDKINQLAGFEGLTQQEKANLLREAGYKRKWVAEYLGVGQATITRWTGGK